MSRIAFLGLGAMGRRMAARLLADHDVVVWNRSPEPAAALAAAGAERAETPREAATGADLVITMLTDDDAARAVWLQPEHGALGGMAPGAVALESSTVTPDWVAELGAAAAAAGVRLLDAPVAGSTPQAEAGALAYLVGGDAETLAEVRPVLDAMGRVVVHAGGPGRGAVLKLMVNALFATQVAVVAELLQLAERHGLPAAEAAELLGPLPVTSPAAKGAAALMVAGDHASRFPVRLVAKDLRYAVAAGAGPVVDAARARFDAIADAGGADDNLTVVHRHR
jgi:3-hydroxyisobutyrate dehydrogenase-like beta-hydroxyacid dehydrogenase